MPVRHRVGTPEKERVGTHSLIPGFLLKEQKVAVFSGWHGPWMRHLLRPSQGGIFNLSVIGIDLQSAKNRSGWPRTWNAPKTGGN